MAGLYSVKGGMVRHRNKYRLPGFDHIYTTSHVLMSRTFVYGPSFFYSLSAYFYCGMCVRSVAVAGGVGVGACVFRPPRHSVRSLYPLFIGRFHPIQAPVIGLSST